MIKGILIAVSIIALIGGLIYLLNLPEKEANIAGDNSSEKEILGDSVAENKPNMVSENVVIFDETSEGKWRLEAKTMSEFEGEKTRIFKGVKILYNERNGTDITFQADEARLIALKDERWNVQFQGNSQVRSSDGIEISADKLYWSTQDKMIRGEGNARLIRGKTVISGDSLEAKEDLSYAKFKGNSKGELEF